MLKSNDPPADDWSLLSANKNTTLFRDLPDPTPKPRPFQKIKSLVAFRTHPFSQPSSVAALAHPRAIYNDTCQETWNPQNPKPLQAEQITHNKDSHVAVVDTNAQDISSLCRLPLLENAEISVELAGAVSLLNSRVGTCKVQDLLAHR